MKSLQYLAMALGVEVVNGEAGTAKKYGVSKAFKKIDKTVNGRFRSNTTTNQMRYHFIIICIFICGTSVYGQSVKQKESKFYNITEIGYGLGIGKIKLKNSNQKIDNDGYSVRLRTQFGYFLSRQFSLGLGFGLDGYHEVTANTAPLFLDARYYFSHQPKSLFVSLNSGYAIPFSSNFETGYMGAIILGKKISTRKLILLPGIGVNIQQLKNIEYTSGTEDLNLTTISFNLGLMF